MTKMLLIDLKNQHKAEKIKLMAMMLNLSDLPETTPNTQALIEQQLLEDQRSHMYKRCRKLNFCTYSLRVSPTSGRFQGLHKSRIPLGSSQSIVV
jgi:hypothetical protein